MPYWQDRVREQQDKQYKRLTRDTERELAAIYKEQGLEIRNLILNVFSKIQAAKDTNEPIQANDLYLNNRYWKLLEEINERLTKLGQAQIEITEPAIVQAYQETIDTIDENIADSVQNVDVSLLNARMIDANQVVNQTWCLDGKNFSDRVWQDKAKLLANMKKALADALVQGKSPWEIAKSMSDTMGVSRRNAYRLVRTETAHAQTYAQTERYKQYGFTKGKFLASPNCCEHCHEHDGEVFTLDELEKLLPVHPNCRCTYQLVRGD